MNTYKTNPNVSIIVLCPNITEETIIKTRSELCSSYTEVILVPSSTWNQEAKSFKQGEVADLQEGPFTCSSLYEAISGANGNYLAILNCNTNVTHKFYHRLYDSACFNQSDIAKGRLNKVYSDGRIVRSNLNKTISTGIQERKQLINLFCSEWHTAIFKTQLCKEVAGTIADLTPERLGDFYTAVLKNVPARNFCLTQDAVMEEKCSEEHSTLFREITETNNNQHVHICAISDNGYAIPTIVMLTSIKHNKSRNTKISVHLITYCIDAYLIDAILALSAEDFEIRLYERNAQKFIDAGLAKVKHIPPFNLIRFDVCKILDNVDKVLYLDGDIIVRSDLLNLYNLDLGENLIAAVRDLPGERDRKQHQQMKADYYINSGVMLMNLREMRKRNISDLLLESRIHRAPSWQLQDQDVFNYVCRNKVISLHSRYNAMIPSYIIWHSVQSVNAFYGTSYTSFGEMLDDAVIVHLCGIKDRHPWLVSNGMYCDVWQRYYSLSPLKDIELSRSLWLPPSPKPATKPAASSSPQKKQQTQSSRFVKTSPHKKELRVLGIPVWSKNTKTGRCIYRLFGIRVRHKKIK